MYRSAKNLKCTDPAFIQWIEALESGKYEQGKGTLYREPTTPYKYKGSYCCLGVFEDMLGVDTKWLCGLPFPKELRRHGIKPHRITVTVRDTGKEMSILPENLVVSRTGRGGLCSLAIANDHGQSFQLIASKLRKFTE